MIGNRLLEQIKNQECKAIILIKKIFASFDKKATPFLGFLAAVEV
ncbi:MAG: hypothetical protein AB8U25_05050 [Rickettsiales endosymbiont of Dermacentor nuttalli]